MVEKVISHAEGQIIEWQWASDNKLVPNPFYTSVYLIDGLLIDSGAPASIQELKNFIQTLPSEKKPKACIVTHIHEDHSGGAFMLKKDFNIPIYASKEAIEPLSKGNQYPEYRQAAWGDYLHNVKAKPLGNTFITPNENYKFDVYPMPGHSPDLIAILNKEKGWAFLTDAVQPKYRMIFGNNSDIQEDISAIYDSIKSLYKHTEDWKSMKIFLSGYKYILEREFLMEKLNELDNIHQKAHEAYHEVTKTEHREKWIYKKVLKKTLGRESAVGKLTREDLSKMTLVKSLLAWPIKTE